MCQLSASGSRLRLWRHGHSEPIPAACEYLLYIPGFFSDADSDISHRLGLGKREADEHEPLSLASSAAKERIDGYTRPLGLGTRMGDLRCLPVGASRVETNQARHTHTPRASRSRVPAPHALDVDVDNPFKPSTSSLAVFISSAKGNCQLMYRVRLRLSSYAHPVLPVTLRGRSILVPGHLIRLWRHGHSPADRSRQLDRSYIPAPGPWASVFSDAGASPSRHHWHARAEDL
ncbi:hypothetical protein C8F01DRAFT_676992 [Mycena amicta]|nr:hypothetical protein C8F01DRAFT_676992 [Mycena amicta]